MINSNPNNNKEIVLAFVLSAIVMIGWQFIFPPQQVEKAKVTTGISQKEHNTDIVAEIPANNVDAAVGESLATGTREEIIAATKRLKIQTQSLVGSINLEGARIDDLKLRKYRKEVEPLSPIITLLSPSGSPNPYYAEYGWVNASSNKIELPDRKTLWRIDGNSELTENSPVTLIYDNGEGVIFKRKISLDKSYMFTIEREVINYSDKEIVLQPYALISRHGTPKTEGFLILHEGPIGFLGDNGLVEVDYSEVNEYGRRPLKSTGGWIGITDKYWAMALVPEKDERVNARFISGNINGKVSYQTDYSSVQPYKVAPGKTLKNISKLFSGAKVVSIIEDYEDKLGISNFSLLIDWGWLHMITRPLFIALEFFYGLVGNFGIAILILTLCVKAVFFPLANKSYVSMSKMKKLQPDMLKIKERYADDRMKQQEQIMALYKKEKVSPVSGCLPILIQIPVFFALYKVLFITLEMRHAPFYGWIKDLAAPDPTTIFNLFGLIPWDPPTFLMVGIWPLLMGVTMFIQMRLNPAPTDPIQASMFNWMPIIFTFLLAAFPAGLVIYWSWNNILSILQQWIIMKRQGVEVDLWGNIKASSPFKKKRKGNEA